MNDTKDGCTCPASSYPNTANDDCIACNMPEQVNGSNDGCSCSVTPGSLANFNDATCSCLGNFVYD